MAHEAADPSPQAGLNNTWPTGRSSPTWTGLPSGMPETVLEAGWVRRADGPPRPTRWGRPRLAVLALLLVAALVVIATLTQSLANVPHLPAQWRIDAQGRLELVASTDAALQAHAGQAITGVMGRDDVPALLDALAWQRAPRWVVMDADRARQQTAQAQLGSALAAGPVRLFFADGTKAEVTPTARGLGGLSAAFWLLAAAALALYSMGGVVLIERPTSRSVLYAVMGWCQAGNLLLIGAEITSEFGLPGPLGAWGLALHTGFDLITVAAMVNAACLHPTRLPGSGWIALAAWAVALGLAAGCASGALPQLWWWTQSTVAVLGLIGIGLLSWSYHLESHPFALVLRQFSIITITTWILLTLALIASDGLRSGPHNIADTAALVWYVYLAAFLLLVPFLARSNNLLREFALLAGVSTVAISLYLIFVALALGQPLALTLALFVSLGVYAAVRHWVMSQIIGSAALTTERMFEKLYRIARELETRPERTPALLSQLLGDLFEPLVVDIGDLRTRKTRIAGDGSSMLVPLPALGADEAEPHSVLLRFARRGRRLFTVEDARLADRVVEQLRRAVHFDRAVEQGRHEERLRLAQDLHDDIGARLLTLMYKAQSPEMEDYVRHTLQDLKTLTRGLAASNHRLSHAAAEWKADLAHRLAAAHVALKWTIEFDDDILLTVVHWSALTRILRELVSNAIAHAQAQRLEIEFRLANDRIELTISDDGIGRNPRAWSHGLGLGGVRKRVKQLGGEVEWREVNPRGISCRVVIRDLSARWQL